MTQIELTSTNESYKDYQMSYFLKAIHAENITFEKRVVVEKKSGESLPVLRAGYLAPTTGEIVSLDLFFRDAATKEDIAEFEGADVTDCIIRIGFWPTLQPDGTTCLVPGKPKCVAYISGGKVVKLSGEKREYRAE